MPLCVAAIVEVDVVATPRGWPSVFVDEPVKVVVGTSMLWRVSSQATL